jgi:hypothetical protein
MSNYLTRMDWIKSTTNPKGGHYIVVLLWQGLEVARMPLEEWAGLRAVQYVADEAAWLMVGGHRRLGSLGAVRAYAALL